MNGKRKKDKHHPPDPVPYPIPVPIPPDPEPIPPPVPIPTPTATVIKISVILKSTDTLAGAQTCAEQMRIWYERQSWGVWDLAFEYYYGDYPTDLINGSMDIYPALNAFLADHPEAADSHAFAFESSVNLGWQNVSWIWTLTFQNAPELAWLHTFSHETGHALGLQEERGILCQDEQGLPVPISNTGSLLSHAGYSIDGEVHFAAPSKEQLGWITPEQIIDASASGTYEITPIEVAGGPKIIRFPHPFLPFLVSPGDSTISDTYIYLEYRQKIGPDSQYPAGLRVHLVQKFSYIRPADGILINKADLYFINMHPDLDQEQTNLDIGESYTFQLANGGKGIKVTLVSGDLSKAVVSIEYLV